MMADVLVYTTGYCPYCTRAKSLLKSKGVAFEEIDVSEDFEKRRWLVQETGMQTVPQIFIRGKSIGGYAELADLDSTGELDQLLKNS